MEGGLIQPRTGMEDYSATQASTARMETGPSADEEDERTIEELDTRGELVACDEGDTVVLEPYEGMEFESEEAAKMFYGTYATNVGFRIRISRYTRSRRDNSVTSRRIVCSKEGFRENHPLQGLVGGEQRQRHRAVTRVGCKAMIMVKKIGTGKWVVTRFLKEHNHGPVPPRKMEVRMVRKEEVDRSFVSSVDDGVQEPYDGMEFDSEEAAKSYYSSYARQTGFRARISKYCRSRRDNSIISRQIVCSKEGFREIRVKGMSNEGKLKRPRMVTRIGCKAMIIVKKLKNSGKWAVSKFDKEHNHALVASKNASLLQPDTTTTGKCSIPYLQGETSVPSGVVMGGCYAGVEEEDETSGESLAVLYNQLCYEAVRYAQEGAATVESYNVAMSALREAVEKVAAAKIGMIPAKALHELQGSNEAKRTTATRQELMLLQHPISFALIPSSTSPNDSTHATQAVDAPVMLNGTDGQMVRSMSTACSSQGMNGTNLFPSLEQPSTATPSAQGLLVGSNPPAGRKGTLQETGTNTEHHAVQNPQRLEFVGVGEANTTPGSVSSQGLTEAQMVAISALPLAPFMPLMGSLPETPSGEAAATAPTKEARPVSADSAEDGARLPMEASEIGPSADGNKAYAGGASPRVHATAIAAGARIIPPKAAASLINAIEARIRSARASLAQSASPGGM